MVPFRSLKLENFFDEALELLLIESLHKVEVVRRHLVLADRSLNDYFEVFLVCEDGRFDYAGYLLILFRLLLLHFLRPLGVQFSWRAP